MARENRPAQRKTLASESTGPSSAVCIEQWVFFEGLRQRVHAALAPLRTPVENFAKRGYRIAARVIIAGLRGVVS